MQREYEFHREEVDEGKRNDRHERGVEAMGSDDENTSKFHRDALSVLDTRVLHVLRNGPYSVDRAPVGGLERIVVRRSMPHGHVSGWKGGMHPLLEPQTTALGLCVQCRLVSDV